MSALAVKRPAPLSVRLTPEMRAKLERCALEAGGLSLSGYVIERLFGGDSEMHKARRSVPALDRQQLSQALALMGQMNCTHDLPALSKAAAMGCLPVTPETETAILAACADIGTIKAHLMAALRVAEA